LLEIAVIDVGQDVLLFGAERVSPPGPLGLPALDLSAVDPDKSKLPLLGPRWYVLRLGAIQFRRWLKRLAVQSSRDKATEPISPMLFMIRIGCILPSLRND
jgi:hypothetical protein